MARTKDIIVAKGEAIAASTDEFLHDILIIPYLAAVEASFDQSGLLVQTGADVAAMTLDAVQSIQASTSLEKMVAHKMAAVRKLAMQQMGQISYERNAAAESKRINAVARYLSV